MKRITILLIFLLLSGAPAAAARDLGLTAYAGGGGRIAVERLARPQRHGPLWNTHRLWINGNEYLVNAADADYLRRCCQAIIDDVTQNRLYDAGRGQIWDMGYKPKEK